MTVIARVLRLLVALAVACMIAALVLAMGFVGPGTTEIDPIAAAPGAMGWIVGLTTVHILAYALVPAILFIALTEGYRLRSVLFYSGAGGTAALLCYYGGADVHAQQTLLNHDAEVIAGAGIAAGLVYWTLAGRSAGGWRNGRAATLSGRGADDPKLPQ